MNKNITAIILIVVGFAVIGYGVYQLYDNINNNQKQTEEKKVSDEIRSQLDQKIISLSSEYRCDLNNNEIKGACLLLKDKVLSADISTAYKIYSLVLSMQSEATEVRIKDGDPLEENSPYIIGKEQYVASHYISLDKVKNRFISLYGDSEQFVAEAANNYPFTPTVFYNSASKLYYMSSISRQEDEVFNKVVSENIEYEMVGNYIHVYVAVVFIKGEKDKYAVYSDYDAKDVITELDSSEVSNYKIDLNTGKHAKYKYVFQKNTNNEYTFISIEKVNA